MTPTGPVSDTSTSFSDVNQAIALLKFYLDAGVDAAVAEARPGDLVLTLGAGTVSSAGERILKGLAERA